MENDVETDKLVCITFRHVYRPKQTKFEHLNLMLMFKTGMP